MNPMFFLGVWLQSQAGSSMSVDQAVDLAIRSAFGVQSAKINAGRAQDLVNLAKAGAGLNIRLNGSYTRIDQQDVKAFPGGGGGFAMGPAKDTTQVALQISQVIDISGFWRRAESQAKFNREAAIQQIDAQITQIKGAVRAQYFGAIQAQEGLRIQQAEVTAAKDRLDKANVRFRNDAIPRFDVLRLETDLRRAEQGLVDARQNAQLAKQALNNTIGRAIDTEFDLVPLSAKPEIPQSPEQLVAAALKTRNDLVAAETNILGLKQAVKREKLGSAPTLVAAATHTETLFDRQPGSARGLTTAGLQVSVSLFDADLTKTRVRSAEKDVQIAEVLLDQARLGVALEVRTALTRLRSAEESYQVALKTEELAKEALRLAQLRYDEGVGILVDVTTAQSEFTRAQVAVVAAFYQYQTAFADLQRSVGSDDLAAAVAAAEARRTAEAKQAGPKQAEAKAAGAKKGGESK